MVAAEESDVSGSDLLQRRFNSATANVSMTSVVEQRVA
jgi:hypothetical protein